MDDSGRPDLVDDSHWNRVLAEYRKRVAGGEPVDDDQFVAEHPEMADALRSWFATSSRAVDSGGADDPPAQDVYSTTYRPLSSRDTIPPGEKSASLESKNVAIPEMFGRYRILRCIGQGAMGAVYLAEDTQLEREVALKVPKFAEDDGPEMMQRFYREAQAAATLRHANVCPVYDVGENNGTRYLTMAYIEGRPLADVIRSESRMPESRAVEIVLKLARALAAAHAEGVIHRDLKPANIMIDEHGEPIIMDFGLARRMNCDDVRLTQAGLVVGSPAYMSPEQVEGNLETMGTGCDIYSLGIIFYELLTGEIPFKGSVAAVMGQIITATPKKPSQLCSTVDPRLEAICLKMMAKSLEDRYAAMSEVVAALTNYHSTAPRSHGEGETSRSTSTRSAAQTVTGSDKRASYDDARRFVLRPWMVWTAVTVVLAGFGVTSWILTLVLRSMNEASESGPGVSPAARQEIEAQAYSLFLDDKPVDAEKFNESMELLPGDHELELRDGNVIKKSFAYEVPPGKRYLLTLRFENNDFEVAKVVKDNLAEPPPQAPGSESGKNAGSAETPQSPPPSSASER